MITKRLKQVIERKYVGGCETVDFLEQRSNYREVAKEAAKLSLERVYFLASYKGNLLEFVGLLENPRGYFEKGLQWSLQTAQQERVYSLLEEAIKDRDAKAKNVCFIEIDIFDRRVVGLVDRNGRSIL